MSDDLYLWTAGIGVVAMIVAGIRTFQMYEKTGWANPDMECDKCYRERAEISLWLTLCVACLVAYLFGLLQKYY